MFPAYESFAHDPSLTVTRWRVYMTLKPPFLDFARPRPVKIGVLSEALRFNGSRRRRGARREDVILAMNWLVQRGYLVEHGRDERGVRQLTIAYALPADPEAPSAIGCSPAFPIPTRSRSA